MKLVPLGDRVVLKQIVAEETTCLLYTSLPGPCRLVHKGRLPEKFFFWHADASEFHFQYSVQRKFRDVRFFPD